MSEMTDRFMRVVRANLNEVLDRVADFEDRGGLKAVLEDVLEGRDPRGRLKSGEEGERASYSPPRSETDKTIKDYYANLEVGMGADKQEVKQSYRRLMKRYHPDRFSDDPEMQQLATELSQELTRAYQEVVDHIERRS